MDRFSTFLVYVLVGFSVFFLAIFFFSLGPLGLFLFAFLVLLVVAIRSRNDTAEPPVRTNCPGCGAPNDPNRDRCKHCNSPLGTADSD